MKNCRKSSAAFTLVEMLVVIAIISLVALVMSRAVRGARRQANAAKCQSNMKNLHTAVVSYVADKESYPLASSYETVDPRFNSKGEKVESFFEERGWVSWLPTSGSRRDGNGKTAWEKNRSQSHAQDFEYIGNHDDRTVESIREGALFKYAGKDTATYRCPEHGKTDEGETIHLAYAMNSWFGSHCLRFSVGGRRSSAAVAKKDSSRLALFIEMDESGDSSSEDRSGQRGKSWGGDKEKTQIRVFADDCVWEWDKEDIGAPSVEIGRFSHRKARTDYTHVVFLDGHVASISSNVEDYKETVNPDSTAAKIEDIFVLLGAGKY